MSVKEITITTVNGDVRRVMGAGWAISESMRLVVLDARKAVVAEFAAGQWTDVINEADRAPDSRSRHLAVAKNALEAISQIIGGKIVRDELAREDGDSVTDELRRIHDVIDGYWTEAL